MATLSISRAWEEGAAFAAREFRLLFPIAFLSSVVPQLLLSVFIPPEDSVEMYQLASLVQRSGIGTFILLALAIGLLLFLIQTFGNLAVSYLTLRPGTSVGESFAVAGRRILAVFAAFLLVGLVLTVVLIPLFLLLGSGPGAENSGGILLLTVLFMVAAFVIGARLLLLVPAGAGERLGPIALIARSWNLTRGYFWRLLGSILLFGIISSIALAAISLIAGLLVMATVGNPLTDRTAMFVQDLIISVPSCIVTIFLVTFIARIYAQLSGRVTETGKVFE